MTRQSYATEIRIIRVMCTGRVDPAMVAQAFRHGLDGLMVVGCYFGDCHYISGNLIARRKFALIKKMIEYVGIEPERVQFSWVSASEGQRFAALINKVIADVKEVGPATKFVKNVIER